MTSQPIPMDYMEVNPMLLDNGDDIGRSPPTSSSLNNGVPPLSTSPSSVHMQGPIHSSLRSRNLVPQPNFSISSKTTIIEEILCTTNSSNGDEPQTLEISDFECALCFRLYHRPVTTQCGHTYCKNCLMAALRYSSMCPLCRSELDPPTKRKYSVNVTLLTLLEKHFGQAYQDREDEEREEEIDEEISKEDEKIPVELEEHFSWSSCLIPSVRDTCFLLSCT